MKQCILRIQKVEVALKILSRVLTLAVAPSNVLLNDKATRLFPIKGALQVMMTTALPNLL